MKPTIYDIANHAKVSKSTVSRVLNNQPNISKSSKEKVLNAIKELNYQPNKLARGLTGGRFDAILAISQRSGTTTSGNPFFTDVIQSISLESEKHNFDLILQTAKTPQDELAKCKRKIEDKMIKGIIILSSLMDESFLKELDLYGIPIVMIGKIEDQYENIYSVNTDNFSDSYKLADLLVQHKHERIACIHAPIDVHVSYDRLAGFRQCLFDRQLDIRNEWIVDGKYLLEDSLEVIRKLLKGPNRPTAIFATDALKSLAVYRVAEEEKLSIPEDISVVGFNDHTISSFFSPKLTGISIPTYELGTLATTQLFKLINLSEPIEKQNIIETSIEKTESIQTLEKA